MNYDLKIANDIFRTKDYKTTLEILINIVNKYNIFKEWDIYPKFITKIHRHFNDVHAFYSSNAYDLIGSKFSTGKGVINEQAYCSALGEMVERYFCFKHIIEAKDEMLFTENELIQKNIPHINLDFIRNNAFEKIKFEIDNFPNYRDKLSNTYFMWYKGYNLFTNEELLIPYSLIINLLQGTNGMTAGNTLDEAILHGLCEVLERDVETQLYDNEYNSKYIKINNMAIIDELYQDFNQVYFKDVSFFYNIPTICLIRYVPHLNKYMTSFGCSLSKQDALIRAILENLFFDEILAKHKSQISYLFKSSYEDNLINYDNINNISHKTIDEDIKYIYNILEKFNPKKIPYVINTTPKEIKNFNTCFVFIENTNFNVELGSPDLTHIINNRIKTFFKMLDKKVMVL